MTRDEIVAALRNCASIDGSGCAGCDGTELDNETLNCADNLKILAADLIENQQRHIETLMQTNRKIRETHYHESVVKAMKREWISVKERLPEDRSDVLVVAYWHERWGVYMGWCDPERAAWSVHIGIGDRNDVAVTHWMPLPEAPEVVE